MASDGSFTLALESAACVLCGTGGTELVARIRDLKFFFPGEFSLVRCQRCRLHYLNPRPTREAMPSFYPESYWVVPQDTVPDPYLEAAARRAVHLLLRRHPGGRVLDVGCGSGGLVGYLKHAGMEAVGVEPLEYPATVARERYGLNVVTGYLADVAFASDSFDAVTLFDVLEHTHDPVGELVEVWRVLKRGGSVYVKVPNIESLQARLFGKWWYGLDTPRHLYHFSPRTLAATLGKAGFRQVWAQAVPDTFGALVFEWSLLFWLRGLLWAQRGVAPQQASAGSPGGALEGQVYASVPRRGKRAFRWVARNVLYAPLAVENLIGRAVMILGVGTK